MNNTLSFARAYASKGWESFPLKSKEKTPTVKWADVATKDNQMLLGWFDNFPDANIGIACGKRSGIVVLDVDKQHNGFESITELVSKHGALPPTPVSKTGNGGEHIFFKCPDNIDIRNSAGKIGKGLDIRANGGYVVAPPSVHPNGNQYEWVVRPSEVELAEMPEWMIEILKQPEEKKPVQPITDEMIPDGQRHDIFVKLAGSMRRKGFSTDAIFQALMVENTTRCLNPSPPEHILEIAQDIHDRYEPQDPPKIEKPLQTALSSIELLEQEVKDREADPRDVWGIPYAWEYLSMITGGKQKGELIYLGGEPGVGKSWFAHQDALFTAIGIKRNLGGGRVQFEETPVLLWSGEMKSRQVYRRFFQMLGVSKRAMSTGKMKEVDQITGEVINHWEKFEEAKAILMNSPIYVADSWLDINNVADMLIREIDTHGIKQAVFDYDWLIGSKGDNEIEQSQNISRTMKRLTQELDISIMLISSVNKAGMNQSSENKTKANLSGSGKKLHDADVIYIMTNFNESKNNDMNIMPSDYQKIKTLHIEKAREMDFHLPGGAINYMRETPNPKFREMKNPNEKPSWL